MRLTRRSAVVGSVVFLAGCQETAEDNEPAPPDTGDEPDEEPEPPGEPDPQVAIEALEASNVAELSAELDARVTELANVDSVTISFVVFDDDGEVAREEHTVESTGKLGAAVTGLASGTEYEWQVVASVGDETVKTKRLTFTTESAREPSPPTPSPPSPAPPEPDPSIEIAIEKAGAAAGGDPDKSGWKSWPESED